MSTYLSETDSEAVTEPGSQSERSKATSLQQVHQVIHLLPLCHTHLSQVGGQQVIQVLH